MTPRSLLCCLAILFLLSFIPGDRRKYIDPANMDLSVHPGDDFYLYANGTWVKNNPVPGSKKRSLSSPTRTPRDNSGATPR